MERIPDFYEYREPFVGGGSVFLNVRDKYPDRGYWINDIDEDLFLFYYYMREEPEQFLYLVNEAKRNFPEKRVLFNYLRSQRNEVTGIEKAVRYFILNRLSYSGIVETGGYSGKTNRFTESSIRNLRHLSEKLVDVNLTCGDYSWLLFEPGDNVFIFLDPPYHTLSSSKFYGANGTNHKNFDIKRFLNLLSFTKHLWMLTYPDTEEIREMFSFAYMEPVQVYYGNTKKYGNELLITNY